MSPKFTQTEKEAIKMLVMEIGINATSKRMGIPDSTINSWIKREGWFTDTPKAFRARSIPIRTPSQALVAELTELSGDSRMHFARGLNKTARHVATMTGNEILERASEVKQSVQAVALTHAWQADRPVNKISLSVTGANVKLEQSAIEAEWSDSEDFVSLE